MKKFLCIFASLLLLICLLPSAAVIAEEDAEAVLFNSSGIQTQSGTVSEMVAAMGEDESVQLLRDASVPEGLIVTHNCVINLNGHRLTKSVATASNKFILKVTDGKRLTILSSDPGGEITSTAGDSDVVANNGTLNIDDENVTLGGEYSLYITSSTVNLGKGAYKGTVEFYGATGAISDGKFTGTIIVTDDGNGKGSSVTISGGTFDGPISIGSESSSLYISGGTFSGSLLNQDEKYDITVAGGKFEPGLAKKYEKYLKNDSYSFGEEADGFREVIHKTRPLDILIIVLSVLVVAGVVVLVVFLVKKKKGNA